MNPFEGYNSYERFHEDEGRWMVMLYHPITKHRTTMSRARYRMSLKLGRFLDRDLETVDHKNEDKTDDDIDNLQLLTRTENTVKNNKINNPSDIVDLICPVCDKSFQRRRSNTHLSPGRMSKGYTCCSRRCGGIYGHLNK